MKSAEEWAGNYEVPSVDMVEAIREEMRQECWKDATKALNNSTDVADAILNAGKPKLLKGQIMWGEKNNILQPISDLYWQGWKSGDYRPLKWSDLCGSAGLFPNHAGDGPVFLREAMDE